MLLKSHQMFHIKQSVTFFFLGLLFSWHEILLQMILLGVLIILLDYFQDVQLKSSVQQTSEKIQRDEAEKSDSINFQIFLQYN